MAAVCSNKLQLEIKKANDIPPAPLFIFFYVPWHSPPKFMRAWTIRDFNFAFFAIHTCFSPYICIIFFFLLLSWWRSRPESRAQKVFRTQYLLRLIIKVSAAEKVEPFPLRALTCSIRLRIFPWLWLWFWFFVFLFSCYPFAVVIFLVNVNGRRDLSRKCLWQCHHLGALGLAQ